MIFVTDEDYLRFLDCVYREAVEKFQDEELPQRRMFGDNETVERVMDEVMKEFGVVHSTFNSLSRFDPNSSQFTILAFK